MDSEKQSVFSYCYTVYTVGNNIPEILHSRKTTDILLVSSILILGILSFGLGRLSVPKGDTSPVLLCTTATTIFDQETRDENSDAIPLSQGGEYVASKNGTVYHLPWCSGAQRIKEENKVWFTTQEEAEEAGYRPAANCKGL